MTKSRIQLQNTIPCNDPVSHSETLIWDLVPKAQRRALVEVGRFIPQVAVTSQLAVLHGNRTLANTATELCSDLAASIRRLAMTHKQREQLESLAVQYSEGLKTEMRPSTVDCRWRDAIQTVIHEAEYDVGGSPFIERMAGNCAVAAVQAMAVEFLGSLHAHLSPHLHPWLSFALHVQAADCPPS